MVKPIHGLAVVALALLLSVSLFSFAADKSYTGTVSDTMCGGKHTMMPGKPDADCVRACVKAGAKYALVVGDKVYTLEGKDAEVDKLAGRRATITGSEIGNTIKVASVTAAR